MSYFSLIYLGIFFLIISILSFFNILYSYYFNLYLNLDSYIYSLFISLFFGLIFLIKKKDDFKISIYTKIITVIIGYLILPLIISVPYYFSIYNISFLDSYFESISGFTSTGFTIFDNIKHIDESLILWRSSSQWIGGLYFLFSIITLLDVFDNNLKKSLTNFLSFNKSETLKQSFKILILYFLLTFILFIIFKIFDFRTFISFNLAMTLISSGGFLPVNELSTVLNTDVKEIIFSLSMLVSFFSIFLSYNLLFFKSKNINFFQEDVYLLFYFLFLLFIFLIFFNFEYNFSIILLSLTSSISNMGFSLEKSPSNLSFIFLILVIIGGSFFSTSSGIRFLKLYTLFKFSVNDLISHVRPKNIFVNKHFYLNISVKRDEINKYFLSLIIFIISLLFLTSLLTISGFSLENSFKLAILTLMNTVNSSMYGLDNFDFQAIHFFSKYYLIFFMIIGRVELLTFLIICKKVLFKN
jgi:trk system potassium uptake protein